MKDYLFRDKVVCYRYITYFLTSLLFLSKPDTELSGWAVPAVILLFISARWFSSLYKTSAAPRLPVKLTLALDSMGMFILLLLTGGPASPFLWYILSPVLAATAFLSPLWVWMILASYMITGAISGYILNMLSFYPADFAFSEYMTVCVMWIIVTQAYFLLKEANAELDTANDRITETMDHIKSLYHMLETASGGVGINYRPYLADCLHKLTKSEHSFIWEGGEGREALTDVGGTDSDHDTIVEFIRSQIPALKAESEPVTVKHSDHSEYMMIALKSASGFIGVMGMRLPPLHKRKEKQWFTQQLIFLAELFKVISERQNLKQMEDRLLINEEQNRIADEMHDRVSQNLFSIVYCIHMLINKWNNMSEQQISEQLLLLKDAAESASKELRATIYSLSTKRNEGISWITSVKAHLKRLSLLNNVEIDTRVTGDDKDLSDGHQKILYRMISEAVGNSIRHGGSTLVHVDLSINKSFARLTVQDNGKGFDVKAQRAASRRSSGLGLHNMEQLAASMQGHFQIESKPGEGTKVFILLPAYREQEYRIGDEIV
ncbi:MAG: histidine kinase [Paenibacillaceae bacterium]|jgi:NarL family two-component system sensor histidine kinase LiaS|nr:histidine kinase [Paenibacillaceae bacterium]